MMKQTHLEQEGEVVADEGHSVNTQLEFCRRGPETNNI